MGNISALAGSTFLNEPYKRWFVFIGVLLIFLIVWNGVIRAILRRL